MLPSVLRNDPGLTARPHLRQVAEGWWGGALWDPRESGAADFTELKSTSKVLRDCQKKAQCGRNEPLVAAALSGDYEAVECLLASGAGATHALHEALRASAEPCIIGALALWSCDLNRWMPEPVAVVWARSLFEKGIASSSKPGIDRSAVARLDMLVAAGADVNAFGRGCEAALHIVSRRLRGLWETANSVPCEKSEKIGLRASASRRPHASSQEEAFLQNVWHNLVARGADASLLDGEGLTPIERLSRDQCRQLLSAKRNQYGSHLYKTARSPSVSTSHTPPSNASFHNSAQQQPSLSIVRADLGVSFQSVSQEQSMISSTRRPSSARR
jgi:hypothetical protein